MKRLADKAARMRQRLHERRPVKVVYIEARAPELVLRRTPAHPSDLAVVRAYLAWLWSFRACSICDELGACIHREPDLDIARGETWHALLEAKPQMPRTDAEDFPVVGEVPPLFRSIEREDGPFAQSKTKPSPDELLVASIIWKHKGRAHPVSIARISELTRFSDREVKDIVANLVVVHKMRIGGLRGEVNGYFVIQDAEDQGLATKSLRRQIVAMARRLAVLESPLAVRELLGQMTLED